MPTRPVRDDPFIRAPGLSRNRRAAGFSLVEMLVVAAIIALLLAILMPSLAAARMQSRIVNVHSDLRQITLALDTYSLNNKDKVPPMRKACGTDINYQLPIELVTNRYLPRKHSNIPQADMRDVFDPDRTYKYRAPGPGYFNGTFWGTLKYKHLWGNIWVPDDFPQCKSKQGYFYNNAPDANLPNHGRSPADYAVWSMGPDPKSPKYPKLYDGSDQVDDNRFPLVSEYWLMHPADTGLITHFRDRDGLVHMGP